MKPLHPVTVRHLDATALEWTRAVCARLAAEVNAARYTATTRTAGRAAIREAECEEAGRTNRLAGMGWRA